MPVPWLPKLSVIVPTCFLTVLYFVQIWLFKVFLPSFHYIKDTRNPLRIESQGFPIFMWFYVPPPAKSGTEFRWK